MTEMQIINLSLDMVLWLLHPRRLPVIIALLGLYAYRCHRRVLRFFDRNEFDEPTLIEINERLYLLNTLDLTFSSVIFAAERRSNISFRGQRLSVIYGRVSAGRSGGSRVFAIADSDQAEWMKANSDVFRPARLSSPFSVFWVELSRLEAELRKAPLHRPAL